ncbi:MAG: NADH-quinone oxidoreductase subunit NuoI [Pseudomonadota bacterium]
MLTILKPLAQGLGLTFRHLFRKRITLLYPEQKMPMFPRWRGSPRLVMDAQTGREKCVACKRCETVCPAQAIKVEGAKREDGSRYAATFVLDLNRCIFCGFCTQECTFGAIVLSRDYELASEDKSSLVLNKDDLLKPVD